MKVNKEDAACIILAFLLVICQVTMMTVTTTVMESYAELTKELTQLSLTALLALMCFVAVYKIPNSWYAQIIYDSTEEDE